MTLTALVICMIAIQLALCMQLGTLCIQLSHLYSAPKLLEKSSFKLEPQYERSVLPRIFHYGKEVGEKNVRDYLAFVFIAAPLVKR